MMRVRIVAGVLALCLFAVQGIAQKPAKSGREESKAENTGRPAFWAL